MEAEKQVHQPQEEHHTIGIIYLVYRLQFYRSVYVFHSHYDQWFIEYYA